MPGIYSLWIVGRNGGLLYNRTLTGTLFMLLTAPGTADAADTLRGPIYDLYTDYVLKNPFHEMDQVVKSDLFDSHLSAAVSAYNKRYGMA
ncbi:hypothetical protein QBZ16_004747 [Prototheca wickerhamii]|uniref:Trafficking protein particle complex subunit n=1 Tax=Prototheca wickerhamii TaxID=3111 RepID=A0AAD9IGB3_PROWI|nr:hypothetical protein QBZ16_004747 [Prototheca wickerhamii]